MFDLNLVPKRYFEFRAPDSGKVLHIEQPKLRALKKLQNLGDESSLDELAGAVASIISKNRENRKVSGEQVQEWMNNDQLAAFLSAYTAWLRNERQNDPN